MSDLVDIQGIGRVGFGARGTAFWELTKPRIGTMVLTVTAIGFLLAAPAEAGASMVILFVHAMAATALVSGGANALNEYLEADFDAAMKRTERRPIPSGRICDADALKFGLVTIILGILDLAVFVSVRAGLVAALTVVVYVLVYTPLKRKTWLSVFAGAIAGALPPVIGWTAGGGALGLEAALLFGIVFFWQLPHFAAIAWFYRDDYGAAGYPVLPVVDPEGTRTDLHMMTHSLGLIVASMLPAVYGYCGPAYMVSAVLLGVAFLLVGVFFILKKTSRRARIHLFSSVTYLPTLLLMMIIDGAF